MVVDGCLIGAFSLFGLFVVGLKLGTAVDGCLIGAFSLFGLLIIISLSNKSQVSLVNLDSEAVFTQKIIK